MAGKLCSGLSTNPTDPAVSKSYCEGRRAKYEGKTAADNPHPDWDQASWSAWLTGWGSVEDVDGPLEPQDCCAERARGPIP